MVDIIVASYNCREKLIDMVESVRRNTRRGWRMFVVDNASGDGAKEWLLRQDDLRVYLNMVNAGFSKATNQGIRLSMRESHAAWTVLVNNDITVPENWDGIMLDALAVETDVRVCSPILLRTRGKRSPETQMAHKRSEWGGDVMRTAGWVGFSCVFIHKLAWQRYGFLRSDREYWHWGSDEEFCLRVRRGRDNWRVCYYTGLGVLHYHSASRMIRQSTRRRIV